MNKKANVFLALFFMAVLFSPAVSETTPIKWESYKDGMKQAKAEKKKVFVNFHADW
jgi:thiol:disulfide interchange protein